MMTSAQTSGDELLHTIELIYNDEQFSVAVDQETYEELLSDEDKLERYTRAVYKTIYQKNIPTSERISFIESSVQSLSEYSADQDSLSTASSSSTSSCASTTSTETLICTPTVLENFKWTREASKLLIDVRIEKEKEFNRPICKKKKLWSQIAKEVNTIGNLKVSGEMCDTEFRNLMTTYKINEKKNHNRVVKAV
ncbi:unnamed protein product [Phaedon cochleariae]|uniref:Myb/SANT-like DNA-binding domain-containing protein n=1 Tax=Phaedon cochleariae TaxID=80249 RepID=A0A9P0DG74_PHACE|nr:unnamed protein product [Phaedon cochleariae]